ncbi:hypothetical protein ACH50O_00965 [Methylomonas sp. 2BW1-5-20]|uniref:hypothetical protein n=1 Tax=Methylomonas sp. 2BW1-5-20 TaxID=3376686 RepID=UPI00405296C5
MSEENSKLPEQHEQVSGAQLIDKTRRTFTKVGVVAPVIMTLANRPAWGSGTKVDCQVSGFTSLHVKGNGAVSGVTQTGSCGFSQCTPKFWHDNCGLTGYGADKWPKSCAPGQDDGTITVRTSSGSRTYKCYRVNQSYRPSWTPVSASTPNRIREDNMDQTSRKCFMNSAFAYGTDSSALWTKLHNSLTSNESLCLAALLSAKKKEEDSDPSYVDFPLSVADCKKVYAAVSSNTSCDLGSGVWTAQQCVDFLNYIFTA